MNLLLSRRNWPALFAIVFLITGCRSLTPRSFEGTTPRFDPATYFEGATHSWGVLENSRGNPIRRFRADLMGKRAGTELVISQSFTWDDGSKDERVWHLRRVDEHHYEATASDVAGLSTGEAYGRVFRWRYTLKGASRFTNVRFNLWMYLQEDGTTMINRVNITKLGVVVARTTEYFSRGPAPSSVRWY